MSKKKHGKRKLFLILVIVAAGSCGGIWLVKQEKGASLGETAYKTETVKRGTVSAGISESGSVEFGTLEQTFSVAEITEVTLSDTDSDSSAASGSSAGAGSQSDAVGAGGQIAMGAGGQTAMGAAGAEAGNSMMTGNTGGSEESSGTDTSLTVEEVYAAAGQVMEKGDPILKINEDSIETYRNQLKAEVESASLLVTREEMNVESKRTEADYTYQMYLAEGETAEETYNATITSLEKKVSDLEEELEEAVSDGDDETAEELEAELQIARNNLTTQSIEAKQTYEKAMTNYKYADQLYAIDTDGLEDDLNDAKDALEEAQQNLEDFEEQIGDGIVYAEYAGTVTEIPYSAGDTLTNDSAIITLTDPDDATMTVQVSQEDISQISVGEETVIQLTPYKDEEFPAKVTGITTSSASGSSTVNYDVAVQFTGDITKVYSGMTGEAVFDQKTVKDTLYISNKAVFMENGRSYVKVLDEDGTVGTVEIKTGFSNGSVVAVESGLEEGQSVVIESKVSQ